LAYWHCWVARGGLSHVWKWIPLFVTTTISVFFLILLTTSLWFFHFFYLSLSLFSLFSTFLLNHQNSENERERGVTWDHNKTHQSINHVAKTHLFTTQNPNFFFFTPISFPRRRCFSILPPIHCSIRYYFSLYIPHCATFLHFVVVFLIISHCANFLYSDGGSAIKKKVEDVVPIATGHEREEIQADLEVSLSLSRVCLVLL
jgi:hypothetical protein